MKRLGNKILQSTVRLGTAAMGLGSMAAPFTEVNEKMINWAYVPLSKIGDAIYDNLSIEPVNTVAAGISYLILGEAIARGIKYASKEKIFEKYLPKF